MFLDTPSKADIKKAKKNAVVKNSNFSVKEQQEMKKQYVDLYESMDPPDGRTKKECVIAFQEWLDSGKCFFDEEEYTKDERDLLMRQLDMPF